MPFEYDAADCFTDIVDNIRVSFDVICNAVYEELPGLKRDALAVLAALKSGGNG